VGLLGLSAAHQAHLQSFFAFLFLLALFELNFQVAYDFVEFFYADFTLPLGVVPGRRLVVLDLFAFHEDDGFVGLVRGQLISLTI